MISRFAVNSGFDQFIGGNIFRGDMNLGCAATLAPKVLLLEDWFYRMKSVKFKNPYKSLSACSPFDFERRAPRLPFSFHYERTDHQAGVIQTTDDIMKAHGGELKVKTIGGNGAEFIIQLPVNNNE